MDMITYAKAKKYADKAVATGGNTELIESLVTEEVTKVVAGADADFDTLKEVADWIKNDKTGAAKMQVDIGTLKTDLKNIELTPGPQGPQGDIGPQGPKGDPSKSAYEYAQDGGYAGTEEEFASDLHEAMNPVQVDWEQANENAIDYIKNKPFGETNEFEYVPLVENLTLATNTSGMLDKLPSIEYDNSYKIVVDGKEYFCEPVSAPFFGSSIAAIGNIPPINGGEWDPTQPPLYIGCFSNFWMVGTAKRENEDTTPYTVSVFKKQQVIKRLDLKYIQDIAGSQCKVQDYVYEDKTYNSYDGAEIFNHKNNVAIGFYSHAEGQQTVALGDCSHAEGTYCEAIGYGAHAEGFNAYAAGYSSHAEGSSTKAIGNYSHAEGSGTEATYDNCHAEGWYTIANTPFLHVQGAFNIPEENPTLFGWIRSNLGKQNYDGEKIVYIYNQRPSLNKTTGVITAGDTTEKTIKELKVGDYFSFTNNANSIIDSYLHASEFIGSEVNSETNSTSYTWVFYSYEDSPRNTQPGKYLHIVGNGTYSDRRSNAHTLEANGTAWYQGDVYVGSTSGVNRDEGSKKLLTADDLVQPNWEQNDEASLDFIKNKPFYDTGEYDFIPVFEDGVFGRLSSYAYFGDDLMVDFILGAFYKVVFNGVDYICEAKKEGQFVYLGNPVGYLETFADIYMTDLSTLDWGTGEPFCIFNGTMIVKDGSSVPKLSIYKRKPIINMLDRKYIDYIPGENTSLKKITLEDDTEYICGDGSEIFNDYINNKAIGEYSHAGGFNTIASGSYSYTEAFETVAEGAYAHAEGCRTKAIGLGSHAEGDGAEAKGQYSHAEGQSTVALGHRAHVEGMNTLAIGAASHVQGKYNLIDDSAPRYSKGTVAYFDWPEYDGEKIVYLLNQDPEFNNQTGKFTITNEVTEIAYKNLQKDNIFLFTRPENNIISNYYRIEDLVSSRENGNVTLYKYKYYKCDSYEEIGGNNARLAHIVGNGTSEENRSNAHTLDWEGNAWYAGSVECTSLILKSSTEGSNKRFRVTIDDNGELHTEEIVE